MIMGKNQHAFITYILVILFLVILISGCQKSGTNPTSPNVDAPVNSNTNNGIPSENSPSLQGNVPFNLIVAEKENVSYFLSHDGDRSGYLVDTGLYRQGINESTAVRLAIGQIKNPQTAGDYVYYLMDKKKLCRVNAQESNPKQEVVLEGVTLYSLYDHWAFYWNKSDSSLYRMDLVGTEATPQKIAGFADLDSLTARGDFILAIERETVRDSQKVVTTAKVWKLSVDGSKKDLLMSDEYYKISYIQSYQDQIYYLEDNIIWRINIAGDAEGKKEEVFLNGAWRSIEDYVEEIHRVQASKGLKL